MREFWKLLVRNYPGDLFLPKTQDPALQKELKSCWLERVKMTSWGSILFRDSLCNKKVLLPNCRSAWEINVHWYWAKVLGIMPETEALWLMQISDWIWKNWQEEIFSNRVNWHNGKKPKSIPGKDYLKEEGEW